MYPIFNSKWLVNCWFHGRLLSKEGFHSFFILCCWLVVQVRASMSFFVCRFDSHSLFGSKINKEVSYPEQLNLRPFMSTNQGTAVPYKLYAVLVHCGYSCNSGHYYCFIKAANNHWYQMNDSTVSCYETRMLVETTSIKFMIVIIICGLKYQINVFKLQT